MTGRDQEVCEHCGHQFRTGLGAGPGTGLSTSSLDAPIEDEAALNRTRQFTLPPLPPHTAPPRTAPPRRRRIPAPARVAALLGLTLAGTLAYFHFTETARAAKPSPVGVWETTPAGRASRNARLRLALMGDGGGTLSWAAGGSAPPRSGQTPLRWHLDPGGRLVLSIPPPDADAVSGTLITVLDSHPWLWRVDRTQHRLVIGSLSFAEIP